MSQQLTIEPLGATIDVEDGQTILDAALRQGIYIPHACGHGLCGTCKVTVLGGDVDHGLANPFALTQVATHHLRTKCAAMPVAFYTNNSTAAFILLLPLHAH